jgi:hypothetical protein
MLLAVRTLVNTAGAIEATTPTVSAPRLTPRRLWFPAAHANYESPLRVRTCQAIQRAVEVTICVLPCGVGGGKSPTPKVVAWLTMLLLVCSVIDVVRQHFPAPRYRREGIADPWTSGPFRGLRVPYMMVGNEVCRIGPAGMRSTPTGIVN